MVLFFGLPFDPKNWLRTENWAFAIYREVFVGHPLVWQAPDWRAVCIPDPLRQRYYRQLMPGRSFWPRAPKDNSRPPEQPRRRTVRAESRFLHSDCRKAWCLLQSGAYSRRVPEEYCGRSDFSDGFFKRFTLLKGDYLRQTILWCRNRVGDFGQQFCAFDR